MAIIPSTTFKAWKDGEVVKAKEYMQELEILRTAINSNGEDLAALKGAAAGILKGIQNGPEFPPNPVQGDMFFRTDEEILYILDSEGQWLAQSPKAEADAHMNSKENPHGVTASQINVYTKEESDIRYVSGTGERFQPVNALFFTNGGSNNSTAHVVFPKAFSEVPTVVPGHVVTAVPYIDTIGYPYIYNVTKTGFSVKIATTAGNLGTFNTPVNAVIRFLAYGK